MNVTRVIVFGIALFAAGTAVVLVRGIMGGGTPQAAASLPAPVTTEILVAARDITPGHLVDAASVRWEAWPKDSVSSGFIVKNAQPDIEKAVAGIVARAPIVTGQPIADSSIVRAGSAGFLAATLSPGMRALGIPVSAESGAGGFILPGDRVDIIFTRAITVSPENEKTFLSDVLLHDVRVLAIDQNAKPPGTDQTVVGKTATIEVSLRQAEVLQRAHAFGALSLALRPLGDTGDEIVTNEAVFGETPEPAGVNVIRYGVARVEEEKVQ